MSRVMEAWQQVLSDAISSDMDEQQFALFQIGLVLLRHNPTIKQESDIEEETLSRELLRLSLNESRQKDAVNYLATLVRNHPKKADSFFYSMSNAQPSILVEPLLELIQEHGTKLNKDAAYHALLALDTVFKNGRDDDRAKIKEADILDILDELAESNDELLSEKADVIAGKIEKLEG